MNYNKDQVFICFRGKDERYGFLTQLKQKLKDGNVNVRTDEDLTGQPLKNIFGHIRNSKVVIVIISENYAESKACLKELVEIKKCVETEKLKAVIPIFYKVKVSNIKEQSGNFGEKFLAFQNSLLAKAVDKKKIDLIKSKIEGWKNALKMITEVAGLTYHKTSPENDFVEKILEKVKTNLARIAAEEGRNNNTFTDPETSKTSLRNQSNQITVNVNQLNVNIMHYRSKSFDGPILSWNPEGYNESFSRDIRRTFSYLDNKDQLGPFPFEAIRVQMQNENQQRKKNTGQNENRGGTNFLSSLLYCFGLGCILPEEQNR